MATRFYLDSRSTILVVTPDAGWNDIASVQRARMYLNRLRTAFSTKGVAEVVATTPYNVLLWQFISMPLSAQTISGDVKAILRAYESATAADMQAQIGIRAVSYDCATVRGTLLTLTGGGLVNEFAAALTNRKFPVGWTGSGAPVAPIALTEGDRLVVELGYTAFNAVTTSYTGYIETGTNSSSDLAENETDTLQYNSWIEFSQDLLISDLDYSTRMSRPRGSLVQAGVPEKERTPQGIYGALGFPGGETPDRPSEAHDYWREETAKGVGTVTFVSSEVHTYFRMRGIDITCPEVQQPAYVFWTVTDEPDWDASELGAGSLPCGTDPSTDVEDIQVAAYWEAVG